MHNEAVHRVALVSYKPGWSYDFTAAALRQHLAERFELQIFHRDNLDRLRHGEVDLIVDFWWKGSLANRFGGRVVKQVSSHRWGRDRYGHLTAAELVADHLRQCSAVLVPSIRLESELAPICDLPVTLCPKGFHPETFGDYDMRRGDLVVGWAGEASAIDKNVHILTAACPEIRLADHCLTQGEMPDFYNGVDVITCASDAEGDPRPLIEGMACGCFPVVVDVGIVPELVQHGLNGLIVQRSVRGFADALAWCRANLDFVRAAGRRNAAEMLRTRTWQRISAAWGDAFDRAIDRAPEWPVNERGRRLSRVLAAARRRHAAR